MNPTLSFDKSIYIQIAEIIENQILNKNLLENDRVPSTNEISKLLQINPATAAKGVNLLVDEEILYKKRGIGMFVSEGARKKVLMKRQKVFFSETIPQIVEEAKRLEISKDELLESINNCYGGHSL